ncbi:MAG TPA: Gfo/Idh/MocA family oxidoreductase [Chloroflexota bacterium]|nr:Gfo/Idh/MocA family oxidoreductase [Chloroflexota bacterium]
MYGVGIIGLGRVSRGHARSLQHAANARLVAACDIQPDRVERFRSEYDCAGETSMEALLARPDVDVVLIALPHGLHEAATVAAARAGKHIMVEKPMAMDIGASDRMIAAAAEAKVQLFIAHTERFIAATQVAKELLDAGEVGTPVMATDVWYQPFRRHTRQPWMLDRSRGGGFLQMAGSHMIDRLVYLVGSPVASVRAVVRTAYHADISCDDAVLALLELENGVPCTFATTSYRDNPNSGVEQHGVELLCTDGMIKVANRRQVFVSRGGSYEEVPVPRNEAVRREWDAFTESLDRGAGPPVSLEHARHVVAVMSACEESSASGQTIRLT